MPRNSPNASSRRRHIFKQNPQFGALLQESRPGGFVEVDAFAKINLFLAIEGRRLDGYHDLRSVMHTVPFGDRLYISHEPWGKPGVVLETNNPNLPIDGRNLVAQAANLICQHYDIREPIHIRIHKRIPVGAGLAGGSANAAAALHGLNNLFKLNIPMAKLMEMGKTLGADVPFCLLGGTALAEGIGDELTPLTPHPACTFVLACPPIHISTPKIFKRLTRGYQNPDFEAFMEAYQTQDIKRIAQACGNAFTSVTGGLHPQIYTVMDALKAYGALGVSMTGTGSAVFAYFSPKKAALSACKALQQTYQHIRFFTC